MTKIQSPIGVSLIYIGSMLLTMNLVAWVCFGAPLRAFVWFLGIWLMGIVIAAIESSCQRHQER